MTATNGAGVAARRTVLDMNSYQWTVLLAAWLGWGFDVFDGLLFNYVAPNCVPTLLGIKIGTPEAAKATLQWAGMLTSALLLGWAAGGILFGKVADRIGRTRTLTLTMALYSLGTAGCAFTHSIWALLLCRIVASLGIGGEWAAGAAMVAEVVPEKRRVEAGVLLYSSASMGLFLATFVNYQIAGVHWKADPSVSWRYIFLTGLIPAAVAFAVRIFVKEPERWKEAAATSAAPRVGELFSPAYRAITLSGFAMALTALVMWWSCNAFIPIVAKGLGALSAKAHGITAATAANAIKEQFVATASNCFNLGGLIGTLATAPIAKHFGRKWMFCLYFALSAAALYAAFGISMPPETRVYMYFPIGLSVFGVFGSFTYYLPELFPTRLRGTGAGFCYNIGRVIASVGPFVVGNVASKAVNPLQSAMNMMTWLAVVPLLGILAMPIVIETKGRALMD